MSKKVADTIINDAKQDDSKYHDSAHSGTRLKSTKIGLTLWLNNNKGYIYGKSALSKVKKYELAMKFIKHKGFIPENDYSHSDDCYYLANHCHIELRGGHRYLRPSNCAKFVLKTGKKHFYSNTFQYAYHGTHPKNIASIYKNGLLPSGAKLNNGQTVACNNGNAFGNGVYTSKLPLYAQMYARTEKWNGKYYQTVLMLRQDPKTLTGQSSEHAATISHVIESENVGALYGDLINKEEVIFIAKEYKSIVIQALLVKVHDTNPESVGGEYYKIREMIRSLN